MIDAKAVEFSKKLQNFIRNNRQKLYGLATTIWNSVQVLMTTPVYILSILPLELSKSLLHLQSISDPSNNG